MNNVQLEKIDRRNVAELEKYTLTLTHEYVTNDGQHFKIDDPIVVALMNLIGESQCRNEIIERLFYKMRDSISLWGLKDE